MLLTALRFNNKAVAQIASDMLLLLADHVPNFLDFYPEVPKKIVEVLARTLVGLTPRRETTFFYMNYQKTLFGEAKEGRPRLGQGYHGHVDP